MAQHDSLKIEGKDHIKEYRANKNKGKPNATVEPSENRRYFCDTCGSCLWCYDPAYKDWIYPFAGIIDTPLPTPSKYVHILLNSKASWVEFDKAAAEKRGDEFFDEYPDKGIEQVHKQNSWWIE
ncbi:hypothetical protein HDU85_004624 [Gaertneriomyces sp. JEL0708]|nr:hypothetical protein HDU85_004624 [Gaertneriomyces sp. JEL0708]